MRWIMEIWAVIIVTLCLLLVLVNRYVFNCYKKLAKSNLKLYEDYKNLVEEATEYKRIATDSVKTNKEFQDLMEFATTTNDNLKSTLEEKEKALKERDEALIALNNFRLTYDKIRNDFAIRTSNSTNYLQKVVSTYDKQAWDIQEKEAVKLGRHDIFGAFNKFRDWKKEHFLDNIDKESLVDKKGYEDSVKEYFKLLQVIGQEYDENLIADTFDITLLPWLRVMQSDLKELEHVLDITPETKTVKQVLEAMIPGKAIPKSLAENKSESKKFNRVVSVSENVQNNGICDDLILSKLQSVIFNIIENSARAIDEHFDRLDYEDKFNYVGMIDLRISETIHTFEKGNITCSALCFEVQDNAGGFPDNYLKDIYKRPVPSSKREGRKFGEGTVYIGFFVDLMNGDIKAENASFGNYGLGALTRVYIPYSVKEV